MIPSPLVFSVFSGKGAYVPFIASGVSRSAGIPTGFEVTRALTRRLAAIQGIDPALSPEEWYQSTHGEPATYSNVVARLGLTPTERRTLLLEFFEPNEEERAQGLKLPTAAHRAIAMLAARGYFRIILTTNFDHLIESALREVGLSPVVISTADQITGMPPLHQAQVTVLKLNGDYLDSRMRNIDSELLEYEPALATLLDRILDEYGLIICGWSAQYDLGLRQAMERLALRRYSTYWTHRQPLSEEATRLANHRQAILVQIADADSFFRELADSVVALEEHTQSDPLSLEIQIARMKRYMQDPTHSIDLEELVLKQAQRAQEQVRTAGLSMTAPPPSLESIADRAQTCERMVHDLLNLLVCGAHWGRQHTSIWTRALEEIIPRNEIDSGTIVWLNMRFYPGLLGMYALGVPSVARGNIELIRSLLTGGAIRTANGVVPWIDSIHQWFLSDPSYFKGLPDLKDRKTPVSDRLCWVLAEPVKRVFLTGEAFDAAFDEWELLLSMAVADYRDGRGEGLRAPLGRFQWRHAALHRMKEALSKEGDKWPYLAIGLFAGTAARATQLLDSISRQPEFIRG